RLLKKHWTARNNLSELKRFGCTLLHGINVKDMHQDNFLKDKRFDRIIFNFPHAGHDPELREKDESLILRHRELLCDFFNSARCLLSENGEIHVNHRDDKPYAQWRIRSLAKKGGLILKELVEFQKKDYPGYHNKRGSDIKSNKTFPLGFRSFTFKFSLKSFTKVSADELSLDFSDLTI
ncbi:heavy metal-associated isoprenylated plant protein 41-like, partial [Phalaenopsis equestris]